MGAARRVAPARIILGGDAMKHIAGRLLSAAIILVVSVFIWPSVAGSATYYVSLTGNDALPGTRPDNAWRHIAYAATRAQAGDTVYIRGGDYGHEHVVVFNSGTSSVPIVFEGYNGTAVLNGSDRTDQGIRISEKNYITFKNVELSMYMDCISVVSGKYITLENIVISSCGGLGSEGRGIQLERCKQSTIRNCEVTDAGGDRYLCNRVRFVPDRQLPGLRHADRCI